MRPLRARTYFDFFARPLLVFVLALAPVLGLPSPAAIAASATQDPKVVILTADKLAFEDFIDFPNATALLVRSMERGASAMMNVRTLGSADAASGFLSLAAGERVEGGRSSGHTFNRDETFEGQSVESAYLAITGENVPGEVLHLGIGELRRLHARRGLPLFRLGEALRAGGKVAAVLGHADVLGVPRRFGPLLVMSAAGSVPLGDVSEGGVVRDLSSPAGWRTDPPAAVEQALALLRSADVVVFEFGELARLEEIEALLTPERAEALRRESLARLGAVVEGFLDALEEEGIDAWSLYLVSPSPSTALGRAGVLLTPVAWWTQRSQESALLAAVSTRRPGIVTNADFLPAVLADLELLEERAGRPWASAEKPEAFGFLLEEYQAIKAVHLLRLPVIQPYFFTVLGLIATGVALTLLVRHGALRWPPGWSALWRYLLAAVLTFPAALLLFDLFPSGLRAPSAAPAWGRLLLWVALLTAASAWLGRRTRLGAAGVVALATALLVGIDILNGASLMKRSLLGYDPVAGSRFYGIGNEYMGVLLGSLAVASAFLLEELPLRRKAAMPVVAFAVVALLLGHPGLGINVGGAISAAVAAWAAFHFGNERPLRLRSALFWLLAVFVVIGVAGILEMLLGGERPSHLGQVVERMSEDGTDPLWALFERKVSVNLKLIRLTVWSRVALSSFALLGVTLFHPNWLANALHRRHPWLFRMARTAVLCAAAALVFNDSGVVAASTLALWPVMTVLSHSIDLASESNT